MEPALEFIHESRLYVKMYTSVLLAISSNQLPCILQI